MSTPPKLARRILRLFAGKADLEDIEGDLEEVYFFQLDQVNQRHADFSYWKHVLSVLFSYGLKKRKRGASYSPYYYKNSITMFQNYFKIAIRNFSKHKLFTSLNIFGLALGMSVCLLALSISVGIYQSDDWQENKARIFQINTFIAEPSDTRTFASTFYAVDEYLERQYPFVEEAVTIRQGFSPVINHHGNEMRFDGYYTEQSFLDVFSFQLIKGDARTALSQPNSIVLTEKVAETLFREVDPIGKMLDTEQGTFTVTGVMANPHQTHLYFQVLGSLDNHPDMANRNVADEWANFKWNYLYVMLDDPNAEDDLKQALAQISAEAATFNPDREIELEYIDLEGVVPRWNISQAIGIGWDQPTMLFFLSIGLLVLLPAVFNYTNMSIARSLKRAKEIGIRKVVGAEKYQIKAQFIVETIILSVLALLGSLVLMYPMKVEFTSMILGGEMLDTSPNAAQVITFLLFSILVGILAGLFPAKYFSRLNPIQTMKGEVKNGKNQVTGFKKGLFVFQFFISLVFVIGVAAMSREYTFALNTNHGFESENILVVPFEGMDKQVVIHELANHPDVSRLTTASSLPGASVNGLTPITSNDLDTIAVSEVYIGDHFIEQMEMELQWSSGEDLQHSNQNEQLVLVNEQFIQSIKVFNTQKDTLRFTMADGTHCRIVGILKNFNYEPLNELINPMMMRYSVESSQYALLSVSSSNIKRTLDELETIWRGIDDQAVFYATFLDDEIEDAYWFLRTQMKFFGVLSTLAITIACLGLLGMVSYTTENRTKEIAVRKIMGATDYSLYYLLTIDFIKLIAIAAILAIPFSYVFYDKVFLYFLIRYGNGLGVAEIILSILFLFFVGAASIYWQTRQVTKANPASKLRYE